ncbi:hypothetical protein [Staphylococcus chromogenes]|nr:hypothetical protein [Staphylococcus chromogenes]
MKQKLSLVVDRRLTIINNWWMLVIVQFESRMQTIAKTSKD